MEKPGNSEDIYVCKQGALEALGIANINISVGPWWKDLLGALSRG